MPFHMAALQISCLQHVFSHPNKSKLLVQNVKGTVEDINNYVQHVFQFLQVNLQFLLCFLPLQPEEYKQYAQCWASPHLP